MRRLACILVVAIAALGFGSSSALAGGSCSGAYSTATWVAGGVVNWQDGMYCTISGSDRIDKVQFYDSYVTDYTVPAFYTSTVNNFIVNVNANGFVGYTFQHYPGWCPPGGHNMDTRFTYKIHQWITNTWGPPHTVYSGRQTMDCHT